MAVNNDALHQQRDRFRECCEKAEKGNKYGADELKGYIKKQKELRKQREVQEYEDREQVLESKKQRLRELDIKCKKIAASKKLENKTSVSTPYTQPQRVSLQKFPSNTNTKFVDKTRASSKPKVKRTKYTCQEPESLEIKSSKSDCKLEREAANFIFKEFENIVRRECRNILKSRSSPTSLTSVSAGAANGIKINAKEKDVDDVKRRRVDKAVGTSFTLYENHVQQVSSPPRRIYDNSSDSHSQSSDHVKPVSSSRALHSLFTDKFRSHKQQPPPYVSRPSKEFVPESVKHAAASKIQAAYKSYKIRSILSEAKLRAYKSFHSSNYSNNQSSSHISIGESHSDVPSNEPKKKKMTFFKPPSVSNSNLKSMQPTPEKPYDQCNFYPNSSKPISLSLVNGSTTTRTPIVPNPEDIPGYVPPPHSGVSQQRLSSSLSPRTLPLLRLKTLDEPFPKQAFDTSRHNIPAATVSPMKLINSISKFQLPYSLQGTSSKDLLPSASSVKVINENILTAQTMTNWDPTKLPNNKSSPLPLNHHNYHHHSQSRRKSSKNELSILTPPAVLINGDIKKYQQKGTFVDLPDPAFSTVLQEKIRLLKNEQHNFALSSTKLQPKVTMITTEATEGIRRAKSPTTRKSQMTAVSKATEQIKKKIVEAKQILEDYKQELLRSSSMSSLAQRPGGDEVTYGSDFEADLHSESQSFSQLHNSSLYGNDSEILSSLDVIPVQMNGTSKSLEHSFRKSKEKSSRKSVEQISRKSKDQSFNKSKEQSFHKSNESTPNPSIDNTSRQSISFAEKSHDATDYVRDSLREDMVPSDDDFDTDAGKSKDEEQSFLSEKLSILADEKPFVGKQQPLAKQSEKSDLEDSKQSEKSQSVVDFAVAKTIEVENKKKEKIVEAKQMLEDYKQELLRSSSMSSLSLRPDPGEVTYDSDFEADLHSETRSFSQLQNSSMYVNDSEILSSTGVDIVTPQMNENAKSLEQSLHKSKEQTPSQSIMDIMDSRQSAPTDKSHDATDQMKDSVQEDESKIEEMLPSDDDFDVSKSKDDEQSFLSEKPSILTDEKSFLGEQQPLAKQPDLDDSEINESIIDSLVVEAIEIENKEEDKIVQDKQILEDLISSMSSLALRPGGDEATYDSDFEADLHSESRSFSQLQNNSLHVYDNEILSSVGVDVVPPQMNESPKSLEQSLHKPLELSLHKSKEQTPSQSIEYTSEQSAPTDKSHDATDHVREDSLREDESKIEEMLPSDDGFDDSKSKDDEQSFLSEKPSFLVDEKPFLGEEPSLAKEQSDLDDSEKSEKNDSIVDSHVVVAIEVENQEEEKIDNLIVETEPHDPRLRNLIENKTKLDSMTGQIVSRMVKEVVHERVEALKEIPEFSEGIERIPRKHHDDVELNDDDVDITHGEIDEEEEWFEDELVTADPAEEKLKREAAEIVAEQLRIENEIRALEALQAQVPTTLLNLSDVPDKPPPPPYSPPSSDSLSFSTKSFAISCTSKQLKDLISKQVEKSWNVWKESGNFPKYEMEIPDDKITEDDEDFVVAASEKWKDPNDGDNSHSHHHQESSGDTPLNPQSCDNDNNLKEIPTSVLSTRAFNTLLFDLIQDTLKETLQIEDLDSPIAKEYVDRIRPGSLALAAQKIRVPTTRENLIETVLEKIKNLLPYPILANVVPAPRRRFTKWTSRPRDLVDEVLAEELIEEDREWTESWPEEILALDRWAEKYTRRCVSEVVNAFRTVYSS